MAARSATRTIRTSAVEFAFTETGASDGVPVFFLHGFPDAPNAYDEVLAKLAPAKRNLRCIMPASRGFGDTRVLQAELIAGQTAALGTDVLQLADALEIRRFLVVGHDWGSRAGFAASILAPDRVVAHFALASPYQMTGGQSSMPIEQIDAYWYQWYFQTSMGAELLRTRHIELFHHIWHRWSPTWKFSRAEFAAAKRYWQNEQLADIALHAYRSRYGNAIDRPAYAQEQALLETKPKIATPTMFLCGTDDRCVLPVSSEEQKKYFTGEYQRIAVKGVGHYPHREDPSTVTKHLVKFFDAYAKRVTA